MSGAGHLLLPGPHRDPRAPRAAAFLLAAALLAPGTAAGAGPLIVGKDGVPRRWGTAAPVQINLDRGPLGGIADPRALARHAVEQWNGVATSRLRIEIGDNLASDVENFATESQLDDFITRNDGTNPMIFDSDGSLFELMFGTSSGVVGIAGPALVGARGTIVKGFAIFNGAGATSRDVEVFKAAITHELGHLLNLDHAQVNGLAFYADCGAGGVRAPGFSGTPSIDDVETMFPILVNAFASPHPMATLHADDRAAISTLYPAASFDQLGTIAGSVVDFDGVTPLQGVNVVARDVEAPFTEAISAVTGALVTVDSTLPAAARGEYEIRGLTPGTRYHVYIEEVADCFTQGSRLGPLDPPADLDPARNAAFLEFWNGDNEAASNPPDSPEEAEAIVTGTGDTVPGVRFIWNGVKPRLAAIEPASGLYSAPRPVTLRGTNLLGALSARLSGDRVVPLNNVQALASDRVAAVVPAGSFPGVYNVIVTTPRGSSEGLGQPVSFEVTEPPPLVSRTNPGSIANNVVQQVSVLGANLLGAESAVLTREGSVFADLDVVLVTSASVIEVLVPAGMAPGDYQVLVTNSAGESPPSVTPLRVTELEPILSGEVVPPAASNSGARRVRIRGTNLAGTSLVELLLDGVAVDVDVVSTSLDEVVVLVPARLEPGDYTLRVTNSEGTTTGPSTFTIRRGDGGGGGCSGVALPAAPGQGDFPVLLALLAAGIVVRRILRDRRIRPRAA
jgi:hypothetical protein